MDCRKELNKFQFIELNGRLMWCDFGANLVQHFIQRYSRYSRYRTKSHDKTTISHDITRYSRYQTALPKLQEIITAKRRLFQKTALTSVGAVLRCAGDPRIIRFGFTVLRNDAKMQKKCQKIAQKVAKTYGHFIKFIV